MACIDDVKRLLPRRIFLKYGSTFSNAPNFFCLFIIYCGRHNDIVLGGTALGLYPVKNGDEVSVCIDKEPAVSCSVKI